MVGIDEALLNSRPREKLDFFTLGLGRDKCRLES